MAFTLSNMVVVESLSLFAIFTMQLHHVLSYVEIKSLTYMNFDSLPPARFTRRRQQRILM